MKPTATTKPPRPPRKRRLNYSLSPATIDRLRRLAEHTAARRGAGKPNVSALIEELAIAEIRRRHLPEVGDG